MASRRACIDCSFLAKALIPSQQTPQAMAAYVGLLEEGATLLATPALVLEFPRVLLKLRNRKTLQDDRAERLFQAFMAVNWTSVPITSALLNRAWSIAWTLGQTGVADALGYAVAEAEDAEFWTSDQWFHNVATEYGLPHVVLVP